MLAKLWENVEVDYANFSYPTVVDFELIKYDTETVKAAFREIGDLYGKVTDNSGEELGSVYFGRKADKFPVFIGAGNNHVGYYSLEILAKGTTLYTSIGWGDSRKDEEVAVETLQKGKPFLWSFVNWVKNWVKNYVTNSLKEVESYLQIILQQLQQGMPAATTEEKGAVKMAGKVDALADNATLVQTVQRLNTLIAQLKSAGIMSEN